MPKLPVVSGKETIKALQRVGFQVVGQKGSHIKLTRNIGGVIQKITIPNHKQLKRGTLKSGILRPIDVSVGEFIELLKR